jgi:hypothetical protein
MELNQTGESIPTNPATTTSDSGMISQEQPAVTPKTLDEAFSAVMDSASARMAGVAPKQHEPAPAPKQDKPAEVTEDKPAATPEQPATEAPKADEKQAPPPADTPRIVKLRVDGQEIEVPEDRLVSLAQQGLDYTKKSQALADQRKQMEAWQAVINRVQTDPAFAARFQGLFAEQPQTAAPAPQETPPEDPVERLKWEIIREAVAKSQEAILGQVKPMSEQQAAIQHAMRLQAVKSDVMRDPAYAETMQMVRSYVESQPTAFRERIFKTLDQDPQAFMEVYGQARDRVMMMRQQQSQQQPVQPPVQPQQAQPQAAQQLPQVERKVTPREAPRLESAGQGVSQTTESAARAQSLKDIRKRVLSGKSTANDLGAFLEATGAIGRMTKR